MPSQFKKTTLEKWIFLQMLAKFYPIIFPVLLSSFSISPLFRSSSFVTIVITTNIFHNSFRIYCKNAIYPRHFFRLFRYFQQLPVGAYQAFLQDRYMEVFCAQGGTFSLYTKKHAAEEEFSAACCTCIFCLSADLLQQSFQIAAAGLPGIGGSRHICQSALNDIFLFLLKECHVIAAFFQGCGNLQLFVQLFHHFQHLADTHRHAGTGKIQNLGQTLIFLRCHTIAAASAVLQIRIEAQNIGSTIALARPWGR